MQIQTVNGREYLYVTTTTTNEVYRLDLANQTISVFANRATIEPGHRPAGRLGAGES